MLTTHCLLVRAMFLRWPLDAQPLVGPRHVDGEMKIVAVDGRLQGGGIAQVDAHRLGREPGLDARVEILGLDAHGQRRLLRLALLGEKPRHERDGKRGENVIDVLAEFSRCRRFFSSPWTWMIPSMASRRVWAVWLRSIRPRWQSEMIPVSSETTTTVASVSSLTPMAARWRVPSSFDRCGLSDSGRRQPAAAMRPLRTTTAPS